MKPFQRTMARRTAMQAIYQWQMTGDLPSSIKAQFSSDPECKNVDWEYFDRLFDGVVAEHEELDSLYKRFLEKRSTEDLDQVDRAILRLACYELLRLSAEVPYKVVINEAVNLAKAFAAEESHRFVNGVLDKVVSKALHLKGDSAEGASHEEADSEAAAEEPSAEEEPAVNAVKSASSSSAASDEQSADGAAEDAEPSADVESRPKPMSLDPNSPGRRSRSRSFSGERREHGRSGEGRPSFRKHSDSSFRKGKRPAGGKSGEDGESSGKDGGFRSGFRKDHRPSDRKRPSGPWKARGERKTPSDGSAE